ncbi:MAG TPA: hypothetical protein VEI02_11165 [Planctomycetota bacterium]|nr:hypothetical protein [Planctomycetota bacterium]
MRDAFIERLRAMPQDVNETWQGGPVKLPLWEDGPDGPYRGWTVLWVGPHDESIATIHGTPRDRLSVDRILNELVEFAAGRRPAGRRPGLVQSYDAAFVEAARPTLEAAGIRVERVDRLVLVDTWMRNAVPAGDYDSTLPGLAAAKGVTPERIAAFAAAAQAFVDGEPWRRLGPGDVVTVEVDGARPTSFSVFGPPEVGLEPPAFPVSPEEDVTAEDHREWRVFFGAPHEIPAADVDAFDAAGLAPTAHGRPFPFSRTLDDRKHRPSARELEWLEAVLRALADARLEDAEDGSLSRTVPTSTGARAVRLTFPFLVRALELEAERDGAPTPNRLVAEAQKLRGAPRERRLKAAVAADADQVEARLLLALDAPAAERGPLLADALAVGARLYEAKAAKSLRRPSAQDHAAYFEALMVAAEDAETSGRVDEGEAIYRKLLDMDRDDYIGAGPGLLRRLLLSGRDEEASAFVRKRLAADVGCVYAFAHALLLFRREGAESAVAVDALHDADERNPYVIPTIVFEDAPPPLPADWSEAGGHEEGDHAAHYLAEAVKKTPGAEEWLDAMLPPEDGDVDEDF